VNTAIYLLNGFILLAISALHLYWAAGGKKALAASIPVGSAGETIMRPGLVACLVVAVGLACFAWLFFSGGFTSRLGLPPGIQSAGLWLMAAIFTLRAIGDFRYVGFFKRIKNTGFAQMDTRWYAPLCAWLGFSSLWLAL
jgi:Protein of unknown function (DUF3995)